ncbi:MAG: YHS domain-containing protein [Acidobacteriota bacterium]|nr:YHS domain-containing protein [Acidobacteriota bacterium]
MSVNPASSAHKQGHDSRTYFFCCAGCAAKFAANPEQYLNAPIQIAGFVRPDEIEASAVGENAYAPPIPPKKELALGTMSVPCAPRCNRTSRGRALGAGWHLNSKYQLH